MKIIVRFSNYVKPYKFLIFLTTLFAILKTLLAFPLPFAVKLVIDNVLTKKGYTVWNYYFQPYKLLVLIFLFLIFLALCRAFVSFFRSYWAQLFGQHIIMDLRADLFQHLQRLSMRFFESQSTGKIMSRIIGDIDTAARLVNGVFINLIMDFTTFLSVTFVLFKMNLKLALLSYALLPLYVWTFNYIRPRLRKSHKAIRREVADMSGDLAERISGIKIVQSFTHENIEAERFNQRLSNLFKDVINTVKLNQYLDAVEQFVTTSGTALVLLYGGFLVLRGSFSAGDLVAFYSYLGYIYFPLSRVTQINVIWQESMVSLERIFEFFDTQSDVKQSPNPVVIKNCRGNVKFENVSFSYDGINPILKNINVEIEEGKIVAIVGSSGAGKSTLVNLIPRFYDVTEGRITIDGIDIRNIKLKNLRKQIGIVLQDTILFSGSVKENISYGDLKASEEQIIEASKAANAHEFIMQLPDGYETEIGERGIKLSGGQKQRLSIARTILKNPKILILDEATSSLDSESENLIQEALERLMVGRTTFVIAHRLSTTMFADMILVLDDGEIVERGTHQQLIELNGKYTKLYNEQFKRFNGNF